MYARHAATATRQGTTPLRDSLCCCCCDVTPVDRLPLVAPGQRCCCGPASSSGRRVGGCLLLPSPLPSSSLSHSTAQSFPSSLICNNLRTHTPCSIISPVCASPSLSPARPFLPSQPAPTQRESKQQPPSAPATTAIAAAAAAAAAATSTRRATTNKYTRTSSYAVLHPRDQPASSPGPSRHPRLPLLLLPLFEWR